MSDWLIRKSTRDDFDDVMKIGEALPGADYLWHRYNSFIDDPNVTCYVVVMDTHVVAFCAVFLIDDGQTYHIRAGRVKQEMRGQGIYLNMLNHVRQEVRHVASIKYDAVIVDNRNFGPMKESLLKKYRLIFSKASHNYSSGTETSKFRFVPHTSVKDLTLQEMTSLIENRDPLLFKSDRIIIDWVPLRILKSNMKYIMGNETKATVTRLEDGTISLLTVGTPIHRKDKMRYSFDVIGDDITLLQHHMMAHIHYVESLTNNWFLHIVAPSSDVMDSGINNAALGLGLVPEDLPFKSLYLLEKNFS